MWVGRVTSFMEYFGARALVRQLDLKAQFHLEFPLDLLLLLRGECGRRFPSVEPLLSFGKL